MPKRRSRIDPNLTRAAVWALGWTGGLGALLVWVAGLAWSWSFLIAINVVEAGLYARDKRAARCGQRRISEAILLAMALAGGSPAALLSGRILRHKTLKPRYRLVFAVVVCVQIGAAVAWLALK